jgi:hypothetical protein
VGLEVCACCEVELGEVSREDGKKEIGILEAYESCIFQTLYNI